MNPRIQCAGLRFYNEDPANISIIRDAVNRLLPFVEHIFVAVRAERDQTNALHVVPEICPGRTHAFPVSPWYDKVFSHVLNGLILHAAREFHMEHMLFMSPEAVVAEGTLHELSQEYSEDTVAVGPVLPGHCFSLGMNNMVGSMIPWNQCALVNIRKIGECTGYAIGGDSPWIPGEAGVEEMLTYSMVQHCYGLSQARIKLVKTRVPVEILEGHLGANSTRKSWNALGKLDTKDQRPRAQASRLPGLRLGMVEHIEKK